MDKTYFFMAGLPRSGSTLLSAILNQNPDIYVTPSADISFSIFSIYETSKSLESHNAGFTPESYKDIIGSIPDMFYQHIDKPYIIDRNRSWGTPETFEVAELFTNKVKIICPVRPILEILASFVLLAEKNPDNFIDKLATEYPVSQFRPTNDARCDALMAANHQIEKQILSLASSLKPEHQDKFHFVSYADLISKPQKVVEAIYNFLEIPKFQHQFNDIEQPLLSNEAIQNGMPDMHTIRPKIDKSKTETSILSEYVHKKYGHALDFIFPNGIKDLVSF